ncbi:phage head morphogenesis protein [Rhizobium phage vB_RleS_L338C]|uniref:phage head morphogenesis protein n=1 Tax=Rhizobium phage vB_RleS_L338C TaxID=1414737 RepID=UPI0003D81AAE|nr:phage head morphogenesis protein [Rhizobium phage vB_RleS_L338C]AHC30436.1 phage head morphogenesis protein [Rhizobium phage vB_RleS_L338C]
MLHTRLKTVPYWRVVANAAASRAYHYGVLKSGQSAGRRYYEFSAILDAKTSETCWALNGMQWPVADAIALMERIAAAEPEEVKTLAPWINYKTLEPMLSNPFAMQSLGVIIPPVHGNCRSTIILR